MIAGRLVETRASSWASAVWVALIAGSVMAAGVIALWYVIDKRAHEHAGSSTDHAIRMNELLIKQDTENRILALDRLGRRLSVSGDAAQREWEADAHRYISDLPGMLSIQWLDATLKIRWSATGSVQDVIGDPDASSIGPVRVALNAIEKTGEVQITAPFELGSGDTVVAIMLPLVRGERFDGLIISVMRPDLWLQAVIGDLQDLDHHVQVLHDGHEVYRYVVPDDTPDTARSMVHAFLVRDMEWMVQVTPTSSFLSAGHADASTLVLVVGLLLSALTTVAVYLALAARERSQQLHDIATQLSTLFQNLPGMAYRRSNTPNAPMAFVSEGCSALSGYARSDFDEGRKNWLTLVHAEDRERVEEEVQSGLLEANAFEVEYRIINRDGEIRWLWERGRTAVSEANQDVHIEGFISDITDRKAAENALIDARAFSEAVVDTAADAIITIDADGCIATFNRAAQQMFGYSVEEALGRSVDELMPRSYRDQHGQFIKRYLDAKESDHVATGREVMALRKDGTTFPIYFSISEIVTQGELKIVGLIRDVSEQRAAESEARQHREHLAHVDRLNTLGEMATGIAHEINQPLTAISLFVQAGGRLAASGETEKLPAIFDKLMQHAHRASSVIERMQSMAKRHESVKETLSCRSLIGEVAKLAEAEARIRDMVIDVDTKSGLPDVSVDSVQIQQVALNLLRNGMEAMQSVNCENGNAIGLKSRLSEDGNIEVAVIDRGSGVSEDAKDVLFAPFATTKKSGMGMGLSISRAIITAHGGRLDFFNNEKGGATFYFTLPPAESKDRT